MKKILVIDRDENTTETLLQFLQPEKHHVSSTTTKHEAIAALNDETFDMVLMNTVTGPPEFNVAKWLLQQASTTKVILIAAADAAPLPYSNVIASFSIPLDFAAIGRFINDTHMEENGFFCVLNDISLKDYIQLVCMKNGTKGIRVSQQNDKGLIIIQDGGVLYAEQDNLVGKEAFFQILSWKKGSFREVKIKVFPPANIDMDYRLLLRESITHTAIVDQETQEVQKHTTEKAAFETLTSRLSLNNESAVSVGKAANRSQAKNKKKKAFLALAVVVPVLLLAVLIQAFNLTETLPLRTVAESIPSKTVAESSLPALGKMKSAATTAKTSKIKTEKDVNGQSISTSIVIGPLHKSETPAPLREEIILSLHGSNTIGAKLAPALVSEYLTGVLKATQLERIPGKKANEVFIKARVDERLLVVEIHAHGSTTGFKDIEAGGCDVAMASRRIKKKEAASLQALGMGDMTAVTNEHVIALDGIAVIVNKSNTISALEMPQLAAIFSGQATDWSEVGGKPGAITVYARDENSGTYDTFKSIALGKEKLKEGIKRFESNPELSEQVSRDLSAIGFTSLPNINKAKAIAIADTGAKPIFPSFFTVATEDYPIARRLYLYTATNPKNHHILDFIEFTHSHRGQEIVNDIDMVDMNIKPFYAEKIDRLKIKNLALVEDYLNTTSNAQRLSLNFRFNTGRVTLDNRAERDLRRVVDFLKDKLDRQIILAGFADNSGDYTVNHSLAKVRAETVAEQMRARGIIVNHVFSCGEELPVASNLSSSGREKNRRVEVWLR